MDSGGCPGREDIIGLMRGEDIIGWRLKTQRSFAPHEPV
jgi:hypothetical protein